MMISKPTYKRKKKSKEFKTNALGYCQYCGKTGGMISRHHIIRRSQGGTDSEKNRIDLCDGYPGCCHLKADQKANNYKSKDLYWKKWEDKKRVEKMFILFS